MTYILPNSERETRRLVTQAAFYAGHTDRLLRAAGITEGMHVLDVGCGTGAVTQQLARIVGPTGLVIGVDADESVLTTARHRVTAPNVTFQRAALPDVELDLQVDAVAGRMILIHLPDPAAALRSLSTLVRPNGIVTFQDMNVTRWRTVPALPLATRCGTLLVETLQTAGRTPHAGERLFSWFREAGLPDPEIAVVAPAPHRQQDKEAALVMLGDTLLAALPFAEEAGLVSPGEFDPDTLADSLRAELRAAPAAVFLSEMVAAWTRVPPD